jgi:integrase/recombinase XerD
MLANNYIEMFLEMMQAERASSKNTIESYKKDLEQFSEYFSGKKIEDITSSDIRNFISYLSKNFSKSSISRKISACKQFFGFLKSEKEINEDPTRLIELPKKEKNLPNYLTEEDILKIKQTATLENNEKGLRVAVFIEILAGSGLRVSEIISLKKSNIQSTEHNNKKHYFLLIKGKGEKERIAPLSFNSYEVINEYLKHYEAFLTLEQKAKYSLNKGDFWLFPSKSKQGYITRQQVANLLKEYSLKAGLDPNKISPHVLRHSFATNILQKGLDLRVLQEILGHSDISTTQIYTHINASKMQNFLIKNHPLAKKP